VPAAVVIIFTFLISPWVKRTNFEALKSTGELTAEVSESLQNFKVVVAFNRRDFFRKRFAEANEANYRATFKGDLATSTLTPVYGIASNAAQLIVLAYGIYLISTGSLSFGILISYLSYVTSFYNPLRQIATLWGNFQVALAGWDRIAGILQMTNDMTSVAVSVEKQTGTDILQFKNVSFHYGEGKEVLKDVSFDLLPGKTYALIGPTGGGKTTIASLMARLYDPTAGQVFLNGVDIRSLTDVERTAQIGFILQEPILFSGTIRDNILYGNQHLHNYDAPALMQVLTDAGLAKLLERFSEGLEAPVAVTGDALSLGQKQLIAFMRTVLRQPSLIILDEATANIDTVTEGLLQAILDKLPASTTRVVIAHRLNTIEDADVIYFVNGGSVIKAGSMTNAIKLLQEGTQTS
jgi:ATP-binding cassette subfamily B protein